jgi:hypothetical protein
VDRDSVGAGHLLDDLEVLGHVLDDVNVLDDLLGDMDVAHDLDLNRGVDVLNDVNVLVHNLGLVHGVGALDVHNLDLGNVADVLDGDDLGHVLDDLVGLVHVLRHGNVLDDLLSLGYELGDMADDLDVTILGHNLGHVADDLLDLGHLHILDGHGDVDGHGSLHMLDLGHSNGNLADFGDGSDDGDLNLLVDILGYVDLALDDDLTRDMADLSDLNFDGLGDVAVLDHLDGHILIHNLVLRDLDDALDGDGASDLLRDLDLLDDMLDLDLGNLDNALNGAVDVLDHGDLHNALLSHDLGNMNNALLGHNLGLNQLGGGSMKGGMEAGQQHWLSQLGGGSKSLVLSGGSEHVVEAFYK